MLNIIYGRAATGKTTLMLEKIKSEVENGQDVVYIVPEQFSFESERAVLNLLGDRLSGKVTVLSFSSLADTLTRLCGGTSRMVLSDADKILFMSKTLKSLEDELTVWKKFISSPGFASKIVDMIGEFKISAVFPEDLDKAALSLEGTLKGKIKALALCYRAYDANVTGRFIDPADKLQKLYDDLCNNKYFANKTVFIDGFKGFTGQQYKIIDLILAQGKDLTVTALCDSIDIKYQNIFTNTRDTVQKLINCANRYNVKIGYIEHLKDTHYMCEGVKNVEKILSGETTQNKLSGENVTLCNAKSVNDEVAFAARNIRRLVRQKGYRYKDFVIIARNPETYESAIEREFAANDISCFFDKRVPLTVSPIYALIDAAVDLADNFISDEIFRYLKTGLVKGFTENEISKLENYVYLWNIDRSDWEKEWDMDPTGFSETRAEDAEQIKEELLSLNALKSKAIRPISNFRKNFNGTVKDKAIAVVNLLDEVGCADNMKAMLSEMNTYYSPEDIDALRQSWDLIMNLLDSIVRCFGDEYVTPAQFREMFALSCQMTTVGRVPQMLDEVTFGAADRIRPSKPKVAFILGANYSLFPSLVDNGSILGNNDRRVLKKAGLSIREKVVYETIEENLLVYSCVCCPSEMLFISCSETGGDGETYEPSGFFVSLSEHLENVNICEEPFGSLCEYNYPETKESAFRTLCTYTGNNTKGVASIAKAVLDSAETKEKFAYIVDSSTQKSMKMTPAKAKKLFGKDIYISATKFDKYHSCRFAYFCQYGLNTSAIQPAKLDVMQRGTIIHYVLEHFCNSHLKDIENVDTEQIIKETDKYIAEYFGSVKGSEFLFTARFNYLLSKIKEGIVEVIERIVAEFKQSSFRPEKCEVSIRDNGTIPTVVFPFAEDGRLCLTGSIDRLDKWGSYIRIVDYKSGSKKFALSDTLYGQNLQMLLYLYAVLRGNNPDYKGKNPAGILYLLSKKDIKKEGISMNGLINNNLDVIKAMEKENAGVFIPEYKEKKSNPSFVPEEAFDTIFDYIEKLAVDMGQTLHSGNIEVDPVDTSLEACKYCMYSAVCGIEDKEHKQGKKFNNDEVFEEMRGGE